MFCDFMKVYDKMCSILVKKQLPFRWVQNNHPWCLKSGQKSFMKWSVSVHRSYVTSTSWCNCGVVKISSGIIYCQFRRKTNSYNQNNASDSNLHWIIGWVWELSMLLKNTHHTRSWVIIKYYPSCRRPLFLFHVNLWPWQF